MHGLERPHQLAGLGAQRHHRIGVLVVAGPLAAPEVRARRRRRQEHQPAILVRRHRRPDIGVAGDDTIMDQRIETPALASRPGIEGTHRAGRRLHAPVIRNRGTDDDDATADHRRRRDLEFAGPFERTGLGLDLAIAAEIRAGNPGAGVECDHADIVGAHEDARAARGALRRLTIDPIGDATAIVAVGRTLAGVDLRIVAPLLHPRAGIEGDHFVEGRTEDQAVFDKQRRRLKLGALHQFGRATIEVAGAKLPGANEIADIVGRDLR